MSHLSHRWVGGRDAKAMTVSEARTHAGRGGFVKCVTHGDEMYSASDVDRHVELFAPGGNHLGRTGGSRGYCPYCHGPHIYKHGKS